jgi:hypothetical protein
MKMEMQCLEFNREHHDKAKVIRDKILRFYFVGEFDVSPFVGMPLSVFPRIMSQIKGDKQSAIYGLLQCIPQLCNVSVRELLQGLAISGKGLAWFKTVPIRLFVNKSGDSF